MNMANLRTLKILNVYGIFVFHGKPRSAFTFGCQNTSDYSLNVIVLARTFNAQFVANVENETSVASMGANQPCGIWIDEDRRVSAQIGTDFYVARSSGVDC